MRFKTVTVRIGVVGTGAIGRDLAHRITALSDINCASAEAVKADIAPDAVVFDTGKALIASGKVDAVLATSWGATHDQYVLAAITFAKASRRRRAQAATASIGPGSTNMVTAAALAHVNRLPPLLSAGDVFASCCPDPVLQQVEDFDDGIVSANDCLRPAVRYFNRIQRPEQLLTALPRALRAMTDPANCGPVCLAFCQDMRADGTGRGALHDPDHQIRRPQDRIGRRRSQAGPRGRGLSLASPRGGRAGAFGAGKARLIVLPALWCPHARPGQGQGNALMPDLLCRPFGSHDEVHRITPQSAGWRHVGFALHRLRAGEGVADATGGRDAILVMVEGRAAGHAAGRDWGTLGDRTSVLDKTPSHCLYLPPGQGWLATAAPSPSAPHRGAADEIALAGLDRKAEARLWHVILVGDVVAPMAIGLFDAAGIHGVQSTEGQADLLACPVIATSEAGWSRKSCRPR